MLLEKINQAEDIKQIKKSEYDQLASEIREFLIQKISVTGGHLGSNLGAVELTMALHLSLTLPQDKLIWDVGHQSYTHKLLTGRKEGFDYLRQYHGLSGFPKRKESLCDAFDTGHSSTSISAGLGLVKARDLKEEKHTIVSVIGDGSLTGGMAYEALNNASKLETNFIIVLNDNNMSISENVGGMSKYLNNIRTTTGYLGLKEGIYNTLKSTPTGENVANAIRKAKSSFKQLVIPGMFFEDMGITYLGPVDGHDVSAIVRVLREAKRVRGPVLVHVLTQKGKGYLPALRHPARFHGAEPFDIKTGIPAKPRTTANYTDIFSTVMCKLGSREDKIVAVSAAMPDGTGLRRFRNRFPERFFDVGIAEEHAVTFAAGMAAGGLRPVVAIYSSFLQRAYDQIVHDVCLQNLPVVFAIDRAGLVGCDGETHQGIFDLSFLSGIPNMSICAPKNKWELSDLLKFAVNFTGPIAIRYPKGEAYTGLSEFRSPIVYGKAEVLYQESQIALFAIGSMVREAQIVREKLKEAGYQVSLYNARFVKPMDEEAVITAAKNHDIIVTLEENVTCGGYGERVLECLNKHHAQCAFLNISLPDAYVEHGNVDQLKKELGIDPQSIITSILRTVEAEGESVRKHASGAK
ncbi:MAG: 1-deoxy-D-xylulose-5-phosphate synthase [Lachnospiraceae bacterium]|jgi:1-deoxy-D-xylulose-5-phosphate synthase|nr:1-deoxy-D-xylulose-5-phosphate synthase [Lachnospiraceae bacterium]